MSRKALGFRLSSAHKLQRDWNDWKPRLVSRHRGDSVSAASQDGVKRIATRDLGPAVYDPTAVGVATSDQPVSPPLLHNDAFPADTLDEGGGYEAAGGFSDTFGWKSLGQELRINDATADLTTFQQHGNRALASKDMRKSHGEYVAYVRGY
ncbi:unnamed protein product [Coregonus sp. 'balchen']|nr:unnamed protein product [Coregonus sp. 'balchen']